jgi:molybdenum cofactor synthesis domain-containing protein
MARNSDMMMVGILTVSDRASAGVYEDASGPAISEFLRDVVKTPWHAVHRIVPDGVDSVSRALIDLADVSGCSLVLTTGGTGPAARDVTPEATEAVCEKMMPGFGVDTPNQLTAGADGDPVAADRGNPRADPGGQSAGTAGFDPHVSCGDLSGNPLLPRSNWFSGPGHPPGSLQVHIDEIAAGSGRSVLAEIGHAPRAAADLVNPVAHSWVLQD